MWHGSIGSSNFPRVSQNQWHSVKHIQPGAFPKSRSNFIEKEQKIIKQKSLSIAAEMY